ncbi:MAG: leucine-rich repeat domain-containing protein [Alkalinema sp. RU_4_3]|nr:leucine-rich repeat domain-containing protein [Alkalinema sp. RU_4_3]
MPKPTTQELLRLIDQAADEGWEELDWAGMGLEVLPPEIGRLVGLKRLVLGRWDEAAGKSTGNRLVELPEELGALQMLEELHLCDNRFEVLPEVVGGLGRLRKLELAENRISEVPDWIGSFEQLVELSLWGNQIEILPDSTTGNSQAPTIKTTESTFGETVKCFVSEVKK